MNIFMNKVMMFTQTVARGRGHEINLVTSYFSTILLSAMAGYRIDIFHCDIFREFKSLSIL